MRTAIDEVVSEYYKALTTERLGQYFYNNYIKVEDSSTLGIFNERDFNKARILIAQFMANSQWIDLPNKLVYDKATASRFAPKGV